MPDLAGFQMITGFQIQGSRDWYVKKQNVLHCKTFVKSYKTHCKYRNNAYKNYVKNMKNVTQVLQTNCKSLQQPCKVLR